MSVPASGRIKHFEPQDYLQLSRVCDECFPDKWKTEFLSKYVTFETTVILLSYDDSSNDEANGFIMITSVIDEANIVEFGIAPAFRRAGLGTIILNTALETLRGRGVIKTTLEVACDNLAALNLYRKTGFYEVGTRRKYYTMPDGSKVDAVVMEHKP